MYTTINTPERHTRVVYTVNTPERHTRVVYTSQHTREAYPGVYISLYTPERHTRVLYTSLHTREAYPGVIPPYTHPRGIPGCYTSLYASLCPFVGVPLPICLPTSLCV